MDRSQAYAVTGAGSGIGRATAATLARAGARVFALDVNADGLRPLAAAHPEVVAVPTDITRTRSLADAAERIRSESQGLDGLVNCAGLIRCGALVELDEESVHTVLDVNVLGAYRTTRALFPLLKERAGRVVNVSSEAARMAAPFNGPYSMSKYALEAYSDSLRRELALSGMKVTIVQPGATRTGLLSTTVPSFDRALAGSQFAGPMRRIRDMASQEWKKGAEPEEVARVIVAALTAKRPPVRVRVGNDPFRRLFEFLPARLADLLIVQLMR